MEKLIDFGFKKIGYWYFENNQLRFELFQDIHQRNVLYSFVCDGYVKYIGKTVQPINQRLNGYKNPGSTQRTNIRINELLLKSLSKREKIDIYILIDNAQLKYRDIKIGLAAGIEDLIFR